MATVEPSRTRKRPGSLSRETLELVIGTSFILLAVAGLIFIRCPSAGQAYGLVILLIIGAFVLTLGLTGMFQLSATIRGISSAGAGTVFLVLFFFVPGVLESIQCSSDHAIHFRVCEEPGCLPEAVAGATVYVRRLTTSPVATDAQGEGAYRYGDPSVGERVQIWAEAAGFTRSAIVEHELSEEPASRMAIPIQRAEQASTALAIPSVAIGRTFPEVKRYDAAGIDQLIASPAGREGDLAAAGTAAFAQGDYATTVKLLEAVRQAGGPGRVPTEAPYLAAAYHELGREQDARQVLQEVRRPVQEAGEAAAPQIEFLEANARDAGRAVRYNDLTSLAADVQMIRQGS